MNEAVNQCIFIVMSNIKFKNVTTNLLYRYWVLSHHLPTDTTAVLYTQHITNDMVNKTPSVQTTKRNNMTKRTSGKERNQQTPAF